MLYGLSPTVQVYLVVVKDHQPVCVKKIGSAMSLKIPVGVSVPVAEVVSAAIVVVVAVVAAVVVAFVVVVVAVVVVVVVVVVPQESPSAMQVGVIL